MTLLEKLKDLPDIAMIEKDGIVEADCPFCGSGLAFRVNVKWDSFLCSICDLSGTGATFDAVARSAP